MAILIKKIWGDEITELTDRIKRIKSTDKLSSKYFVFKCSIELSKKLKIDFRSRKEIIERLLDKPVFLLQFDKLKNTHILLLVTKDNVTIYINAEILNEIRYADLCEVIYNTQGDCLHNAPNDFHFITPSGKHTTRFLRLTDAIYSYNALDRISFWLLPLVANSSAVLIDTWSLSAIITHTLHRLGLDLPFDCFHEHINKRETGALVVLNKLSRRITSNNPVLVIVGLSSSGSFFRALPSVLKKSSIPNELKTLSIYGFKNTPSDVDLLARLNIEIEWFSESECIYCLSENQKTTYQIDRKYYYPRIYSEKPVRFTTLLLSDESNAESSSVVFIKKYGSIPGVLVVHKDDQNDGMTPRHHAFDINVSRLIQEEKFRKELFSTISKIERRANVPKIVVSPPHKAAKDIISVIQMRWPEATYIHSTDLSDLSDIDKNFFKEATHICFIDDGLISGSRIEVYLRNLRENFDFNYLGKLKNVSWFPLILRPPSEAVIKSLKDSLSGHSQWNNGLYFIYKVFLPDWSGVNECPWCIEKEILDKFVGPLWADPIWYKKRRDLLNQSNKGITQNSLFVEPFSEHKTLGAGSPLADVGFLEMQLLFLITTGLQVLRNRKSETLGKDDLLYKYSLFWQKSHLDPQCGTFERFSEPLIQSCFLRAVKMNEWAREILSVENDFLEKKIKSGKSNELIGEFLLFYLRLNQKAIIQESTVNKIRAIADDEAISNLLAAFDKS